MRACIVIYFSIRAFERKVNVQHKLCFHPHFQHFFVKNVDTVEVNL